MTNTVREWIPTVYLAAPTVLAIAMGLTYVGATNEVGPWWFWANDACPDSPEMVCGMLPLGPAVASGIAAVTVGLLVRVFSR